MALYNQFYDFINLTVSGGTGVGGAYYVSTQDLGNGISGASINRVQCISAGTIQIYSFASSNSFTIAMTSGQFIDIMLGGCKVRSGAFIGIKGVLENYYAF